jgi:hypothetical protein
MACQTIDLSYLAQQLRAERETLRIAEGVRDDTLAKLLTALLQPDLFKDGRNHHTRIETMLYQCIDAYSRVGLAEANIDAIRAEGV